MKIVINTVNGGFGLSPRAYERLIALGVPVHAPQTYDGADLVIYDLALKPGYVVSDNPDDAEGDHHWTHVLYRYFDDYFHFDVAARQHPLLVQVVEELGDAASDDMACLKVVDIPDDVPVYIDSDEYGCEKIVEEHRTWR